MIPDASAAESFWRDELLNVLLWWAYLFALGMVLLPVTALVFSRFFDFGYPFWQG